MLYCRDMLVMHVSTCVQLVQGKGNRAIRYSNCSTGAELYMHPKSYLHKAAPEYVVYAGLTRTDKRTYMNTLSTVEPGWVNDSSSVYMNARKVL